MNKYIENNVDLILKEIDFELNKNLNQKNSKIINKDNIKFLSINENLNNLKKIEFESENLIKNLKQEISKLKTSLNN